MKKFHIKTLGCKVNQYESEVIAQQLQSMGYEIAEPGAGDDTLDVIIVNTCSVTQKAAMQSRQATRQVIRSNPGTTIIVTGCHAQIHADEFRRIEGVDEVIAQNLKHTIPDILAAQRPTARNEAPFAAADKTTSNDFRPLEPSMLGTRTRPFIKIQDGCDAFCTYCIVPYSRGRSRSMPFSHVMDHVGRIKQAGYKEVVLTGIHLGCYGQDLAPSATLMELLDKIHTTRAIERLRLSSIEPHELSDDILELVAQSDIRPGMICNHFHIPLQSGDDHVLKKMNRPYTRNDFISLVNRIHRTVPDAAIGVDVLAGFPGETENAFKNTYDLIDGLPVTYLHVFPFSSRPGTPAARFPDPVPTETAKQRCSTLRQLGLQKKKTFYRQQIGKTVEILIEGQRERTSGLLKGLTSNYIPVLVDAEDDLQNSFVTVTLSASRDMFIVGSIQANN